MMLSLYKKTIGIHHRWLTSKTIDSKHINSRRATITCLLGSAAEVVQFWSAALAG